MALTEELAESGELVVSEGLADPSQAIARAAQVPDAAYGQVEVRPVLDLRDL